MNCEITTKRRMMDLGDFQIVCSWRAPAGDVSYEYWEGLSHNGAILCDVSFGNRETFTHYSTPEAAVAAISARGLSLSSLRWHRSN